MASLTTDEAARRLGISSRRVVELLRHGLLDGRQVHTEWLVSEASVGSRTRAGRSNGRPLTPATTRAVVQALSGEGTLGSRHRSLVTDRDVLSLASALSRPVRVDRYAVRDLDLVRPRLRPTGEDALDRIVEAPVAALAGVSRSVHGYLRDVDLADLVDDVGLVPADDGAVHIHRFRDDVFPWHDVPRALVAVDAARSEAARVRAAGLDALERMRSSWLA